MTVSVKTNNSAELIRTPVIYASLISQNKSFYTYLITYEANPVIAIRNDSYLVDIKVDNEQKQRPVSSQITNFSGLQLIENIRSLAATTRSAGLVVPNRGVSITSNISSRISNDMIKNISNASKESNSIVISQNKQLVTRRVSEELKQNRENTVFTVNVNTPGATDNGSVNQVTVANKYAREMTSLLYEGRIEPASLSSNKSNTVVYPKYSTAGTVPARSYIQNSVVASNPKVLNILASQTLPNINSNPTTQRNLSNNSHITVLETVSLTYITLTEVLNIPVGIVGQNDFNLKFEVKNRQGQILQSLTRFVPHGANVSNIIPIEPPTIQSSNRDILGRVTFTIKQNDPGAQGVFIYRRIIDPQLPLTDATYTLIDKISLTAAQNSVSYTDKVPTLNNTVYRIVPYVSDQIPGSVFASFSVKGNRNKYLRNHIGDNRQVSGVLDFLIVDNRIQIKVSKFSVDTIVIKLYRKNISIHEKDWTLIKSSALIQTNSAAAVTFDDNNVKQDNTYEYRAGFVYTDGAEYFAYNNVFVKYIPITGNVATTTISNPIVGTYQSLKTITFDVNYSLSENNFELIKKLLTEQNLLSEYGSDVIANKERLTTLLSYSVTRINLTTGEIEDFGTIPSRNFNDRLYGLAKNVKNLSPSNEYVYKITTYVRQPESLMPNLVRTVNTIVGARNVSYTLRPFKWLQPITLRNGTIVSERSLAGNYAENQLSQGAIVDITETPKISLFNPLPAITRVNATKNSENSILLEWAINGDLNKIDHFIVKLNVYGMESIVGNVHNVSTNNTFKFIDLLTNGEQGPLIYSIVPIYYDYNQGTPAKAREVVV